MKKSLLAAGILAFSLSIPTAFAADSVTVQLSPENASGESGTATLTAMGDQTQVVIDLSGAPATGQPAHIHNGQCGPTLNPKPLYPLTPVVGGKSTTMVAAKLSDMTTGGFAINLHKSPQDIPTYVACGNIAKVAGASIPAAAPVAGGGYSAALQQRELGLVAAMMAGLAAFGLAVRRTVR